jgi:tetratricopeptide (TPR) repeat protein
MRLTKPKGLSAAYGYIAAYGDRGDAYMQKGNYEAAIRDYTKVIELLPKSARAYDRYYEAYEDRAKAYDKTETRQRLRPTGRKRKS